MNILKQSTAATIKFGPMIDDTDGKTAETALTISQADIRLSKNGGDFAQTNNAAGATHDENGYYDIPLNTTDTGTLGRLRVAVSESGALPVWQDFLVVTANVYDSLVGGSDKLDVNAAELGGTAQTGNDVGADVNEILTDTGTTLDTLIKDIPTVSEFEARTKPTADYFDPAADTVANVTAVGTTTNLTNLPTMPADWLTASGLKADAVAEIQAGLALEATLTAMKGAGWTTETLAAIDVLIDAIKVKTDLIPASPAAVGSAMTLANDAITAAKISADAITEIQNGLAKSADLQDVEDKVDVIALDTTTEIPASITTLSGKVDTIDNFLDTEIAAILEDTGTTLPATLAAIEGKVDTADAVVDAIKLKTDTIPASPAQAGEYTAAIAAIPTTPLLAANYTAPDNAGIAEIKAKTDQMTFTIPGKIDASATIDTTGVATSTELEAVDNKVDAIKAKTDLMNASAITYAPNVIGTTIALLRGDTFTASLPDTGALTGYQSIDFTVKASKSDTDDGAVIRIRKSASGTGDGLLRLNGKAPTTETGSITVNDEATGDITITLDETATDDLSTGTYVYDVQLITATGVQTLTSGSLKVTADVTRAVV